MAYDETNIFQNKAELKVVVDGEDGEKEELELGTSTATATVQRDPVIIKTGKEITSYNNDYPIVEWTITINKANHHIYGAILTDNIGSGLELIDDTIEIFNSSGDEVGIVEDGEGYPRILTKNEDKMEIGFGNINSSYTIKYQTKIISTDRNTFENKASLRGTGRHGIGVGPGEEYIEYDVEKDVNVLPDNEISNNYYKSAVKINYVDKTMEWKIVVDAKKEAIESLKITDIFEPSGSMVFLEAGFTVKKGEDILIIDTDYTLEPKGKDGFVLEFSKDVGKLGKGYYEITYKTSFDPNIVITGGGTINNSSKYKNKAELEVTVKNAVGEGTTDLIKNIEAEQDIHQDIYNVGKKSGKLNRENREITWTIYLNAQSQDLLGTDLVVTDTIGEGQTFKENSLVVKKFTLPEDGQLSGITTGDTVDKDKYSFSPTGDGFILTFENGINNAYLVEYTTVINGISKASYDNTAIITDKTGKSKTYYEKISYERHDKFISKEAISADNNKVYADDEINWKVTLNESLSEINNAVFTDIISAGHVYV